MDKIKIAKKINVNEGNLKQKLVKIKNVRKPV
jgi:hypothetical protein